MSRGDAARPKDCGHEWRTERDEGTHDVVQHHTCYRIEGHYPEPHGCITCGQEQEAFDESRQSAEREADLLIRDYDRALREVVEDERGGYAEGMVNSLGIEVAFGRVRERLRAALLRDLS